MSQQAAVIRAAHAQLVVEDHAIPTPGPGQLLVKIKAIGFSPLEAKIQKYAMIPLTYPNVLGTSYAGIVESVGEGVTKAKAGDQVAVVRTRFQMQSEFGAFQQYALAGETSTSKLPESVSLDDAASTILNLAAIASAFSIVMGLDRPSLTDKAKPNGKKIFLYGGSSPAGGLGVSYAVAAGYTVVTTSSPANKEFVQSLGPAVILDHTASNIADETASHGPYDAIFDAIGFPAVTDLIAPYLSSVGGGTYYSFVPLTGSESPLPKDVQRVSQPFSFAMDEEKNHEFRDWFYNELLPKGLESGVIVPTREQWLEGGLAKAQEALDLMLAGKVSGRKLLLDPNA
jgi:NADPH:quinone reductase-like Zn-dependent oxidoreductase